MLWEVDISTVIQQSSSEFDKVKMVSVLEFVGICIRYVNIKIELIFLNNHFYTDFITSTTTKSNFHHNWLCSTNKVHTLEWS